MSSPHQVDNLDSLAALPAAAALSCFVGHCRFWASPNDY
jgi:hypothetical protein